MDRVRMILRHQWLAYWRRYTRAGRLRVGDQAVWLILSLFLVRKYWQLLQSATVTVAAGQTKGLEQLLAAIFFAWMFPMLTTPHLSITTQNLRHLPLSLRELFAIRTTSLFVPLSSWLLVVGSLAICLPLARTPNPIAGIIALLLFMTFSLGTGMTIAQLMNLAGWRRFFAGLAVTGVGVFGLFWLANGKDVEGLQRLLSFFPGHLVTRAAFTQQPWTELGALIVLTLFSGGLALWAFGRSLKSAAQDRLPGSKSIPLLPLPGKGGGLAAKDCRYFFRLLDPYLGFLLAAMCVAYLVSAEAPSAAAVLLFITLTFTPNASLAFNGFGLETETGLSRYALLPLSGAAILGSKNVAFAVVMGAQVGAIILLAGWRLGPAVAVIGLLQAGSLTLAYLTWGNWVSVDRPFKMRFFRFSSGGSLFDAVVGLLFGSLPGVVAIYLPKADAYSALWKMMLVVLVCAAFYALSVRQAGDKLERTRESIGWRLS